MKTPNIQNVFKMMIGTSALIASTAFFINTISPVQASEVNNTQINPMSSNVQLIGEYVYFVDAGYMYVCEKDQLPYFSKWEKDDNHLWKENKFVRLNYNTGAPTVVGGKFKLP